MQIPAGYLNLQILFSRQDGSQAGLITQGLAWDETTSSFNGLAEDLFNMWQTNGFWARMDASWKYTGARIYARETGGLLNYGEYYEDVAGGESGLGAPGNCAFLVQKRTGFVGRKFRGRLFLPGVYESSWINEDGTVEPTIVADLQARFDDLLGIGTTPNRAWTDVADISGVVLLHSSLTAPTPVSQYVVQPQLATQRRRMRK